MKKTLLFLTFLVSALTFAQESFKYTSIAKPDYSKLGSKFDIVYKQTNGKVNQNFLLDIAIKAPLDAAEITNYNAKVNGTNKNNLKVSCFPFLEAAKVKKITTVSAKGLPPGISAYLNEKDFVIDGGQNATLRLLGKPIKAGYYPLEFKVKAAVTVLGVPSTIPCTISGAYIKVE